MGWEKIATIGAKLGTDLKDESGSLLDNEAVKNDELSLAFSGTSLQIKKGSTQIGSNLAAPDALKNSEISSSDLSGSGKVWATLPASAANNYSLPTDVLKGTPTISGTTITIPRNSGSAHTLTTQDTTYTFSWGEITYTDGGPACFISSDGGSTYTGYNNTGELSITHPTLGVFSVNYEWGMTLTSAIIDNITSFTLTNDGSGNDAWTKSTFPTASTSIECTVTHTASGKTFTIGCNAQAVTFGEGGTRRLFYSRYSSRSIRWRIKSNRTIRNR